MHPARLRIIAMSIAVVSIGFFFIRIVSYVARPTGGFIAYYTGGAMLLAGDDMRLLYDDHAFTERTLHFTGLESEDYFRANPPTLAFLMAPFSFLPITKAKLAWEMFSLACTVLSLYLLQQIFSLRSTETFTFTAFVFGFSPLYINFVWGQVYAPLLLLHVILFKTWVKEKQILSAIVITFLLALKGYGLMFLVLALFQKRWKIVFYTIALYLALIVISSFVVGIETWSSYASSLTQLIASMPPAATFRQNIQSLVSWIFLRDQWNPHPLFNMPEVIRPLLLTLFIGALIVLYRLAKDRDRRSPLPLMVAIIIGVLTAPILYDYHYTLLLPAIFLCYRYLSYGTDSTNSLIFGIALLLLSPKIPYHISLFQDSWMGILGFPRVYGSVLLLWLFARISKRQMELPYSANDFLSIPSGHRAR